MSTLRTLLAAAALLGTTAALAPVQARDFLTVTGQGENFAVRYDEAYRGNVVGGGYARFAGQGQSGRIAYDDPALGRQAPGIPVLIGGQHSEVVYLAPSAAPATLAAR
ncbi:hypothetical protein [Roseomonas sp. KE0001]|uniref:hypothetical protein n=1 Tax=unclassified Roseomonas TaxID=2617492 RepID=UPI0018DF1443|nr:hypothetical protein [Roseomonas sp. KE0001]